MWGFGLLSAGTFPQFSGLTREAGIQTIAVEIPLIHRRLSGMMQSHMLQVRLIILYADH